MRSGLDPATIIFGGVLAAIGLAMLIGHRRWQSRLGGAALACFGAWVLADDWTVASFAAVGAVLHTGLAGIFGTINGPALAVSPLVTELFVLVVVVFGFVMLSGMIGLFPHRHRNRVRKYAEWLPFQVPSEGGKGKKRH